MLNRYLVAALVLLGSGPLQAQDASPASEADLGRRFLQCSSFYGLLPIVAKASGSTLDTTSATKLKQLSLVTAVVLMGEDSVKSEGPTERKKFPDDIKALGITKALDTWSENCGSLIEKNIEPLMPRIEALTKKLTEEQGSK